MRAGGYERLLETGHRRAARDAAPSNLFMGSAACASGAHRSGGVTGREQYPSPRNRLRVVCKPPSRRHVGCVGSSYIEIACNSQYLLHKSVYIRDQTPPAARPSARLSPSHVDSGEVEHASQPAQALPLASGPSHLTASSLPYGKTLAPLPLRAGSTSLQSGRAPPLYASGVSQSGPSY